MREVNFKMIELARLSRGLTQKDLVSCLPNINQSSLSKIEKGILAVNDETLANISKLLDYPLEFFYSEELKTPISSFYFRKRATVPQKSLDKIFADLKIVLKSIDVLLREIDLQEYPKFAFDFTDGWTYEAIAIRVREILKIPSGPVKNIISHLEDLGIIVYFYDSSEVKFDGLTCYTDNGYPVIFVNKNMSNDRLRFTIAHELGHLSSHIPCNVEPWRDVEEEANNFASEFLMPKKDCYKELQAISFNRLAHLKTYWGVSKAAIIRRARNLDAINQSTYQYLMIELGRRNERKNEKGYVELDEPSTISKIIALYKDELGYSRDDVAGMMYLSISDYAKLFDPFEGPAPKLRFLRRAI